MIKIIINVSLKNANHINILYMCFLIFNYTFYLLLFFHTLLQI